MNLRDLRTAKKLSVADVAKQVYATKQAVSHWECGRVRLPIDRVDALAGIYDVEPYVVKSAAFESWSEARRSTDRLYTALARSRNLAKLSREDAAIKLGVGVSTLYRWEHDPSKLGLDKLLRLAELYSRDPMALLREVLDEID